MAPTAPAPANTVRRDSLLVEDVMGCLLHGPAYMRVITKGFPAEFMPKLRFVETGQYPCALRTHPSRRHCGPVVDHPVPGTQNISMKHANSMSVALRMQIIALGLSPQHMALATYVKMAQYLRQVVVTMVDLGAIRHHLHPLAPALQTP